MKKYLLAATLVATSGIANAGLSFDTMSTVARTEAFNLSGFSVAPVGSTVALGALKISDGYRVTYTYLGQESGYDDKFYNLYVAGSKLLESGTAGVTSVSASVPTAGALDFSFEGNNGKFAYNDRTLHSGWNSGGTTPGWSEGTSIGLIGTNMTVFGKSYAAVIGYNDSAGSATLGDWDDFVIGVNIAPIPEPETYAMMLAGLGLMGFVARRRKQKNAA